MQQKDAIEGCDTPSDGSFGKNSVRKHGKVQTDTRQSTPSWYGGAWPRGNKSSPVTKVAKESITAAVGATSEAAAVARVRTPPLNTGSLRRSLARQSSASSSRPSEPISKGTVIAQAQSYSPSNDQARTAGKETTEETLKQESSECASTTDADKSERGENDVTNVAAENDKAEAADTAGSSQARESINWRFWFLKTASPPPPSAHKDDLNQEPDHLQDSPAFDAKGAASITKSVNDTPATQRPIVGTTIDAPANSDQNQRRSWLSLWGNSVPSPQRGSYSTTARSAENVLATIENPTVAHDPPIVEENVNRLSCEKNKSDTAQQRRSSGWAFWSRDVRSQKSEQSIGEVAMAGSPSQSKPEKDVLDGIQGVPIKVGEQQKNMLSEEKNAQLGRKVSQVPQQSTRESEASAKSGNKAKGSEIRTKIEPLNLLLPSFKSTYGSLSRPGLVQQLGRWFPFSSVFNQPKHLELSSGPPRVKRALVIGVHGYFPTPFVRSFLGQPTGTSIRFANSAASSLQKWAQAQGYACEIEKVALEGEGKIAERIEVLWSLLLNWIDKIRKADFLFVACHSQGCPVALILVAKLIAFGCVSSTRIGVCAMAGVNQGPFIDYKTRWIGATALELFDFAKHDSKVSKDYRAALETVLKYGVKVLYVGSIDDQLVSLEVNHFASLYEISTPDFYSLPPFAPFIIPIFTALFSLMVESTLLTS